MGRNVCARVCVWGLALMMWLCIAPSVRAACTYYVMFQSPTNTNFVAPASIPLSVEADGYEDPCAVAKIKFYNGSTLLAEVGPDGDGMFSYTWTGVSAGTYTITAKTGQETASDVITVTVASPQNQAPIVSMATPTGSPFIAPAPIGLSASASDSDGTINRVEFFKGGTLIATDTAAPYQASYNASSAGTYSFTARATDNSGASTTSAPVSVTVAANTLPTVSITAPANNASYITPATIAIAATASDSDGSIARVEFRANGTLLASDTSAPYQASWSTGNIGGTYPITATAFDNKGGQKSASLNVVLNTPTGSLSANPNPCTIVSGDSCNTTVSWTSNDPAAQIWRHYDYYVQTQEGIDDRHSATQIGTGTSGSAQFAIGGTKRNQYFELVSGGAAVTSIVPGANHAPSATLTAPSDNQLFQGPANITISATPWDSDGTISKVQFYAGGTLIAPDTEAPYSATWSTATGGTYTLSAQAFDNLNATHPPVEITVTVNAQPTITLASPASDTVLLPGQSLVLTAEATDSDITLGRDLIEKIEFYVDGTLFATWTYGSGAPSVIWTPATPKAYSLTAKAYDSHGGMGTSPPRTVVLDLPPTVKLTAPVAGTSYAAPAAITLTADATDPDSGDSIARVEFYAGSTLLATDTTPPYAATWSGVAAGTYMLTAKATDSRGITAVSYTRTITVLPAGALTRRYVYDAQQRLCKTIEPETDATAMAYDDAGNLVWSAAGLSLPSTTSCDTATSYASGRRVDRSYDARNRLTALAFPYGNGSQNWSYTPDGLPAQITTYNDAGATTVVNAYSYNKRRLLTRESQAPDGRPTWTVDYGYTGNGALRSLVYPDGLTLDYAPDALGRPTQAGSYASGVRYYPNGALKAFIYGNGIEHTLVQNMRQLPERSLDTDGGVAVLDDSYDYDPNGNVAAISDGLADHRGDRDLTYDGLDRLKTAASPMFISPITPDGKASYEYDVLDNLTTVKAPGRDWTYYYDPTNNRLTNVINNVNGQSVVGLDYDEQGNLKNKNGQNYDFDYGNRLRVAPNLEVYRYDGHGRRISKTATTGTIWSLYGQDGVLRFEQNERQGQYADYIYLSGSLIAKRSTTAFAGGTATTTYQHTDALGSPVAVTDENRTVVERTEYEPYGAVTNRPLRDGPGYTGHVEDAATGLVQMQQRYYDPGIGRFLSVDPVTADGNTGDNFNRYWYANNNPYRYYDPDGRCTGSHIENNDGTCASSGDFTTQGTGPTMPGAQTVVHQAAIEAQAGFNSSTAVASLAAPSNTLEAGIRQAMLRGDAAELRLLLGEVSGLSASDMAMAQRAAATIESLGAGDSAMLASRYGIDWANRVHHIFEGAHQGQVGQALITRFGSPAKAFAQIQRAVEAAHPGTGPATVNVGGIAVQVRGAVVDGVYKISTVLKW